MVTLGILMSGCMKIEFRSPGSGAVAESSVDLQEIGAYVIWEGEYFQHRWNAVEDTVMMTVRWPNAATPLKI